MRIWTCSLPSREKPLLLTLLRQHLLLLRPKLPHQRPLLRPLLDAGLLPPTQALTIQAVSGYSGGGKARIAAHEAAGSAAAPLQVYGLGLDHKHVPEIQHGVGDDVLRVDQVHVR